MVLHLAPWPHSGGTKPFVLTEPHAVVEVQAWFAGSLLLPLAARLMHAAFLHATSKKAEEKGVNPYNHNRAAMNFVKAIAMVDILLLVWPVSVNILAGIAHSMDLSWILLHIHWRLFRWALAVLSSVLLFELLQRPPRFWRFLHHCSIILVVCLMCGIPWLSLYDLLLFSAGMMLHMSFLAFNCVEFFAVSWHFMRPGHPRAQRLLRGCAGTAAVASLLGHGCVILFYLEAFHLFQAWAPLLVLIFLQVCLVCENVHNVYYVWNLAERTQASLDAQAAQEQSQLPTMLGSCGLGEEGFGKRESEKQRASLAVP
ncbi:unnamed protein product [Symbiodinium natans]|uniref:Uncharacterized protein n=1 Tax=Symbiodinium natans TaxID=878477 RepID=A0A812VAF4_9DINO|nr:unnamed protein product [Symbiodinium natans]